MAAVALLIFIIALLKGNVLFCNSFYGTVLLEIQYSELAVSLTLQDSK
jgi:hypothetical protein